MSNEDIRRGLIMLDPVIKDGERKKRWRVCVLYLVKGNLSVLNLNWSINDVPYYYLVPR